MTFLAFAVAVEALTIVWLLVDRHVRDRDAARERAMLLNAAIARHSGEFVALQRAATPTDPGDDRSPAAAGARLIGLE